MCNALTVRKADPQDLPQVTALALALWPAHTAQDLTLELSPLLESAQAAIFLALLQRQPVGFAQCQLRHDYVEGTGSSPVGYLEGIYVAPDARRQGIARALLAACEAWSRAQGCREFASDCELDNAQSLRFHLACGFAEQSRIICFAKPLEMSPET